MGLYAMTGGATGIGAAIKQRLRDDSHEVIVADLKDADILADLSTPAGRDSAIAAIRRHAASGLDGFIPCAGVAGHLPNRALIASLNYFGTVSLVEGLQDLLAARKGSVVLISSNSAPHPTNPQFVDLLVDGNETEACAVAQNMQGHAVYSGTKQAIVRWMRRSTGKYAAAGVRLNAVAPGYTQTPMTRQVEQDPAYGAAIRDFMASIPVGRPGQPEDIAALVCFLLGKDASFICGSLVFADGGHDAVQRPDLF